MREFSPKVTRDITRLDPEEWFVDIFEALAGAHHLKPTSDDRKSMKELAVMRVGALQEPHSPIFRLPYFLLYAYADWLFALASELALPAEDFDQRWPDGINFRRYLGAWLYSVATVELEITPVDIEAIFNATGVAMLPHPLLPIGCSTFLPEIFTTTAVDMVSVADLCQAEVLRAFKRSQVTQ